MATEMHPGQPDGRSERWLRAWSHREQLLRVARRRSMSAEDAEDAVHEAMVRAMEHPHLDDERLGAWLTTVTIRLCVDRHRQVGREADIRVSPRLATPLPAPVDESVCDRAEARWLAARSGELPARQAEAIWLKSEDLDVAQVATKMGLSYRTVESLLARARRTLRSALAATLGLLLWLLGRGRPATGGKVQAAAVAATAVTLAVAGFVLPHVDSGPRPASPRPGGTADSGSLAGGGGSERDRSAGSGARPSPSPGGTRPTAGRGPLPLVSALPGVGLPEVSLAELDRLPERELPTLPVDPPQLPVPTPSLTTPELHSPSGPAPVPSPDAPGVELDVPDVELGRPRP
ncbi:sigma-70 family RNA polymerase sigma factor [Streptomyces sp. LHD-70]|uniref:RNA polymerase sigma factor n=1 Tax=Streptomyces sp. LHD-70 TaxID=3072140 RepID=UPI00280DFF79|nr:sigma-70 family RNA polymerase sigma factor [Streptomyces sp. LHD-70]MDQ8705476.1 sigma-70 family RNA polymerase sigma factor [Streptomyces sp. LHD-70]